MMQTTLDDLATTAFPADCRACGGPLLSASAVPVCERCVAWLPEQPTALCRRCGEALDIDLESARFLPEIYPHSGPAEGLVCTPCRLVPPSFERAVAYAVHQDAPREMVHLLKYEPIRAMAKPLGRMLAHTIEQLGLTGDVVLVAVPLHSTKEYERGYNQAVLLANAAAQILQSSKKMRIFTHHAVLMRTRATESQLRLTPRGRHINVRGAFTVKDAAVIAERTILLVDDVYTTGATVGECAHVLKKAGAARIFVATVTRAQAERVERWDWNGSSGEGRRN